MRAGPALLFAVLATGLVAAGVSLPSPRFPSSQGGHTPFATRCEAKSFPLPQWVTHTTARYISAHSGWVSAPTFASPNGEGVKVAFCQMEGVIEGDIGFEIWLAENWNGRILTAGVGGEAGYFNYRDMARGVEQGFVTASTDTGHKRGEPWIDNPRKAENYAHRAYHLLTVATKEFARSLYGKAPSYSYFIGCSGGGRQALRELQLYPDDYDGALIGAPGLDVPLLAARLLHAHLAQSAPDGSLLEDADWALVAKGAVTACDKKDGVEDGIIADPRQCGFQPAALLCQPGQASACLSPEKLKTVERIIAPLTDEEGTQHDNGLLPGITARPGGLPDLPVQMFGTVVHQSSAWKPEGFSLKHDLSAARAAFPTMDARSADFSLFAKRGGKVIFYQGWADASVQPEATLDLFERMGRKEGQERDSFARLYLVPGMQHCRGGSGTDRFGGSDDRKPTGQPQSDLLQALMAWVEQKSAPAILTASRAKSTALPAITRPLCPYPAQAIYRGTGDTSRASSFICTQ